MSQLSVSNFAAPLCGDGLVVIQLTYTLVRLREIDK